MKLICISGSRASSYTPGRLCERLRLCSKQIDSLKTVFGGTAFQAKFSVIDREQMQIGMQAIQENLGPVDLIINNATGPQPEFS